MPKITVSLKAEINVECYQNLNTFSRHRNTHTFLPSYINFQSAVFKFSWHTDILTHTHRQTLLETIPALQRQLMCRQWVWLNCSNTVDWMSERTGLRERPLTNLRLLAQRYFGTVTQSRHTREIATTKTVALCMLHRAVDKNDTIRNYCEEMIRNDTERRQKLRNSLKHLPVQVSTTSCIHVKSQATNTDFHCTRITNAWSISAFKKHLKSFLFN